MKQDAVTKLAAQVWFEAFIALKPKTLQQCIAEAKEQCKKAALR